MRAGHAGAHASGAAWLLGPYGVGVVALLALPAALTFGYALTNYTGFNDPTFTGLTNVRRAISDPLFHASLRASLWYVVLAVPLRLLAATGLALLTQAPRRFGRLYRAAAYLPTVIPDVALALVFLWVFNPVFGPINQVLGALGLVQPIWLSDPWGARWAIVIMMAFPIGEAFLAVLAGRRELNPSLYDAARVDGAAPWQQFRYVTLPQLAPLLALLAIRDTIMTLQVNFVPAYVMTDGGPDSATLFLPVYVFDQAFEFFQFGYGALLTVLLLGVTAALIGLQALLARRWRVLG